MKALYNDIGNNYNATRRPDDYLLERFYYHITTANTNPISHLDLGCGTGNYTIELAKKGLHFIGIDPSGKMIREAAAKSNVIDWRIGQAEQIEMESETVDTVIAQLTIHHWQDLGAGFKEIHRVLKKKGRFVLFTSTPQQMKGYWLNHYFPRMLEVSMRQMPALDLVESLLMEAQFKAIQQEKYFVKDDLKDLFLYAGKNRPELYFRSDVRKGISSFAALSNKAEVEAGLQELERDVAGGRFEAIKNKYVNEDGDYLFLIAEKGA